MFAVAAIALFIGMIMILIRLYAGPTLYDRVLSLNAFGTYTVLFIGILGFLTGRPDFLDVALLYALINFAGTIAVLKYFRYRAIGDTSPTPSGKPMAKGKLNDQGAKS
jgi:multicomponent Na+:H+ antiporter subunit F